MEEGFCPLRQIEKLCKNDIRYMHLLDGMKTPSFSTFGNFIRNELTDSIEQIFKDINSYIFEKEQVDLEHVYIDGTKIEANANRYTWVWKKSCTRNLGKVFDKISALIDTINQDVLGVLGIKLETRDDYAIEYVTELLEMYKKTTGLDENTFVSGCGHRKSIYQKQYQELQGYLERLKPYASDTECFVPLMEKFNNIYGHYPKYPVADAGYGSYNNYLYCEEHGMEKYMKFTMSKKETEDKKYHADPYRAVNFKQNENRELTSIHQEVILNLESMHGALLRMNRSIKAEGTFGIIKWDRSYKRLFRRGGKNVILELTLISCGFNLYKYHNKQQKRILAS